MKALTRMIIGGDVMLGRLVKVFMRENGYELPLQGVKNIMKRGDITLINLECAMTASIKRWSGPRKAFYFGADPIAAEALQDAGVNLVSLANNHALDFDFQGLTDTLYLLDQKKISHAGAGENLGEALTPALIERNQIKFGMVAFCDHQDDFAAEKNRPGIAYVDLNDEQKALALFQSCLNKMRKLKIVWPILSLHWGPNMVDRPSAQFKKIAHQVIEMGYKMLFGHSAHVFHGIEIYQGCPILYAAGDLVDDYAVDPLFKNDHQCLFELQLENLQLKRIIVYPVFIVYCTVNPATEAQFQTIANRLKHLNAELGTHVIIDSKHNVCLIEPE